MFIYNSPFNFDGTLSEATGHHKIIGELRRFSEPRNKILHGHAMGTYDDGVSTNHTYLRTAVEDDTLIRKQIELYRSISEGLNYYLHCYEGRAELNADALYERFLDSRFLDTIKKAK